MTANRAIVLFGATGDLAMRMLFPSLYFLDGDSLLPADFTIIGVARAALSRDAFIEAVEAAVRRRCDGYFSTEVWARFRARLDYCSLDVTVPAQYSRLGDALKGSKDILYYLSTSPGLFGVICSHLQAAGLTPKESRIVIEKPIGHDLASCRAINDALAGGFDENRIFRIDHYLGKEAVQNLIALRFANRLFEPLWNHVSIDHVQITVAETVGVEGRWSYYDEHGAIRDMVQNHMLQLLCLVAMEPPVSLDPDSVRNEKVKVLRSLKRINGRELSRKTVRGQYLKGVSDGVAVPGYAEEATAHDSDTESFVAICAHIDNWRWANVPFYLRTGKRMPVRSSQIVIQFRAVPHSIFPGDHMPANRLTIRLQPQEEIALSLMNKTPSLEGMELRELALNLSLSDVFKRRRRIAYERLFVEAINNNPTLFVRRDEVEEAWRWIDSIIEGWRVQGLKPTPYAAGTWGPSGAFALTERNGHSWHD